MASGLVVVIEEVVIVEVVVIEVVVVALVLVEVIVAVVDIIEGHVVERDCAIGGSADGAFGFDAAQDFVFHGQTGRGKTHLAIAIGIAAVNAGKRTRFFTVAEMVMHLADANRCGRLDRALSEIERFDLLILDELGYVPLDIEGARSLYQVMASAYEKRSVIVTANIEFSKWGTVFGDDKLASAVIDRIVHHGRLVEFNGTSHRMNAALMLGRSTT